MDPISKGRLAAFRYFTIITSYYDHSICFTNHPTAYYCLNVSYFNHLMSTGGKSHWAMKC